MRFRWYFPLVAAVGLVLVAGCQDEGFVGDTGLYAVALTDGTAPLATSREAALYITERRVELPIEPPTDSQMAALSDVGNVAIPYPRLPWVQLDDYEIEVDWTVKNVSDQPVNVAVTINGFNEFDEYVPAFALDNDDIVPDFAMWEWVLALDPGESRSMTTREEQMREMAIDLATVVNGLPNANLAVSKGSQSAIDPRVQPYIPDVIPALTGFRIGLRVVTGGGPPPQVVLEATVRLRDLEGKIADPADAWVLPMPAQFTPPAAVDL